MTETIPGITPLFSITTSPPRSMLADPLSAAEVLLHVTGPFHFSPDRRFVPATTDNGKRLRFYHRDTHAICRLEARTRNKPHGLKRQTLPNSGTTIGWSQDNTFPNLPAIGNPSSLCEAPSRAVVDPYGLALDGIQIQQRTPLPSGGESRCEVPREGTV